MATLSSSQSFSSLTPEGSLYLKLKIVNVAEKFWQLSKILIDFFRILSLRIKIWECREKNLDLTIPERFYIRDQWIEDRPEEKSKLELDSLENCLESRLLEFITPRRTPKRKLSWCFSSPEECHLGKYPTVMQHFIKIKSNLSKRSKVLPSLKIFTSNRSSLIFLLMHCFARGIVFERFFCRGIRQIR